MTSENPIISILAAKDTIYLAYLPCDRKSVKVVRIYQEPSILVKSADSLNSDNLRNTSFTF